MVQRRGPRRRKPPPTERRFGHTWHEIVYLHSKLAYWWREGNRRQARRYVQRLEACLRSEPESHEAILGEKCWSLLAEFRGDVPAATRFLQHAMDIMAGWFARNPKFTSFDVEIIGHYFRPPVYGHLAELYLRQGDLAAAQRTLLCALDVCTRTGLRFGANTLLRRAGGEVPATARRRPHARARKSRELG